MPLSPIDVTQQTFRVSLRGYDEGEVDEFLEEVVKSMKEYDQRLRDADERASVLEDQLQANRETEDAMRRAFVAAQRAADEIVAEARTEAEVIIADAGAQAAQVSADRLKERDELQADLLQLRTTVKDLKQGLAAIASGVLPDVEAIDQDVMAATSVQVPIAAQNVAGDSDPNEPSSPPEAAASSSLAERVAKLSATTEIAETIPPFATEEIPVVADPESLEAPTEEVPRFGAHRRPNDGAESNDLADLGTDEIETEQSADDFPPSDGGWLTDPGAPLPGRSEFPPTEDGDLWSAPSDADSGDAGDGERRRPWERGS